MTPELLKPYQQHAQTLTELLEELKAIAEDADIEPLLGIARGGLIDIVKAIEPVNELAIAMIEDTVNIDCNIDQSEFLGSAAAAIYSTINSKLEAN